jgi:hypothetical protein
MNIEQLGSLGEFIAAIATLATLVYLTVQIRQNTKQLRFSNAASLLQGMNTAFDPVYEGDNQRIFHKAMSGEVLPAEEMMAFRFICFRIFSHFYQLDKYGNESHLTSPEIEMHRNVLLTMLTAPGIRTWWGEIGQNTFPAEFTKEINTYMTESEQYSAGVKVWKQ